MKLFNLLFLCSGNTCRSPMAAAILKHLLAGKTLPVQVKIRSAGLSAILGMPASAGALRVFEEEGIGGLSNHQSTPLSRQLVDDADLILVMTSGHMHQLLERYPDAEGKVFRLTEYCEVTSHRDVHDPFGQDVAAYRVVFSELKECLETLAGKIMGGLADENSAGQ